MKSPFLPLRGSVIISDERQSFDYRGLKPQIRYAARFRRMLRYICTIYPRVDLNFTG